MKFNDSFIIELVVKRLPIKMPRTRKRQVRIFLEEFKNALMSHLANNKNQIHFKNFGTFLKKQRKGRKAKSVQNQIDIVILNQPTIRFVPAKHFKQLVKRRK